MIILCVMHYRYCQGLGWLWLGLERRCARSWKWRDRVTVLAARVWHLYVPCWWSHCSCQWRPYCAFHSWVIFRYAFPDVGLTYMTLLWTSAETTGRIWKVWQCKNRTDMCKVWLWSVEMFGIFYRPDHWCQNYLGDDFEVFRHMR